MIWDSQWIWAIVAFLSLFCVGPAAALAQFPHLCFGPNLQGQASWPGPAKFNRHTNRSVQKYDQWLLLKMQLIMYYYRLDKCAHKSCCHQSQTAVSVDIHILYTGNSIKNTDIFSRLFPHYFSANQQSLQEPDCYLDHLNQVSEFDTCALKFCGNTECFLELFIIQITQKTLEISQTYNICIILWCFYITKPDFWTGPL